MCLTLYIYPLGRNFIENVENFFGGYPHLGPLKAVAHKNEHPRTPYDPTFLLQNPVLLFFFFFYASPNYLLLNRYNANLKVDLLKLPCASCT